MSTIITPSPQERPRVILEAALDHDPADREAFLALACEEDAALLAEVRALLEAHEAAPAGFLDSPAQNGHLDPTLKLASGTTPPHPRADAEREGERIGRYKLLQKIGEGGFGTVWMAEQVEPVTRRVALKIIKLGMDTREVIARFEAERQALAMMDHPNIAKVLDGGATDRGRPFFVMELVKGMPITQYCDEAQLGARARLALFGDVCSAINHAHQKGVIHRDIKPSNVMITLHGDKPVVQVIDFGIAKATQGRLTDKTLFTRFEQFVGTPVYMSPEQTNLSGLDVDTRSDIYALGILLYELLTGRPPFDAKTLASAGYDEMRRIIREVEPPKPSSRLSTVAGEERTDIARARHIDPAKLGRLIEPDLDWIVMKAIDKDRARRYETANGLALDLQRFLSDEPVTATPPSAGYRMRKFVRRNRAEVMAASVLLLVLVMGIIGTTVGLIHATRSAAEARLATSNAEARRVEATEQKARAERGERLSNMRLELLKQTNSLNSAINDATKGKRFLRDGEEEKALAYFRKAIERNPGCEFGYDSECLIEAEELKLFQTKLGLEHPDTLRVMNCLASRYQYARRHDLSLPLFEQTLNLRETALGAAHPDTLRTMNSLAGAYRAAGKMDLALRLGEETVALQKASLGADHPDTLTSMHDLADGYQIAGKLGESLPLYEKIFELRRSKLGPEHPDTNRTRMGLGHAYAAAGDLDRAIALYEENLEIMRIYFGPQHFNVGLTQQHLFPTYASKGDKAKVLQLLPDILAGARARFSKDSSQLAGEMTGISVKLLQAKAYDAAEPLLREVLAVRERNSPENWSAFGAQSLLGSALLGQKKYAEAEPLLLKGYEGMKDREPSIPTGYREALPGTVDRLVELSSALHRTDEVKKWQAERGRYPGATAKQAE